MKQYKVTGLDIKDFKRLALVKGLAIDPEKGLVTIGGENGNGKSSILESIEWVLGRVNIKNRDRDGGDGAMVRVIISEKTPDGYQKAYRLIRDGNGLKVLSADGDMEIKRPADWVKAMIGNISVDPLRFLSLEPRDQRAQTMRAVGADTDDIDREIRAAMDEDNALDAAQKKAKAQVEDLPEYPDITDTAERDAAEIIDRLRAANDRNMKIITAQKAHDAAKAEVARLEQMLADAKRALDAMPEPVDAEVDTTAIENELQTLQATNAKIRANIAKQAARDAWMSAESTRGVQRAKIATLKARRDAIMEGAKFPIPELGWDDTGVTYNGRPLSDASKAEQIRAATAISLAGGGQVPIVLIREGGNLDNKALAAFAEIAEQMDAQILVEIATNCEDGTYDKSTTFVVEDGAVLESPKFAGVPA